MFKLLLGLSALFVAFCGGFFSVKGIGLLFAGSFWAVIIMAASLEFGKIMATSFLYRYWQTINKLLKIYLVSAVTMLMGITSLGIFGFLSEAFYSTKSNLDAIESQISLLEQRKTSINLQLAANNERIRTLTETRKTQENNRAQALNQSTTATVTKSGGLFGSDKQDVIVDKRSLELKNQTLVNMQNSILSIESQVNEVNKSNSLLLQDNQTLDDQILNLKKQVYKSDIGTYKFIAKAFNVDIEIVVKWFILIIVIVFDPLALSLLLAFNIVINKNKLENNNAQQNIHKNDKSDENIIELIYDNFQRKFKRGTKKVHNEPLHDPQTPEYARTKR